MPNYFLTSFLRLPHFKGKTRIENLLKAMLWAPKPVALNNGLKMELDPIERTEMMMIRDGCFEPLTTLLYEKILKDGDIYLDVGAHVGYHTLIARRCIGEAGKVIAVEPQPHNADKVLANWRCNHFENITIYVAAAGEKNGTVHLNPTKPHDRAKFSLFEPFRQIDSSLHTLQTFVVPIVRLDTILQQHEFSCVKLLKIDAEGFEKNVIEGLGDMLAKVENIVLEFLEFRLLPPIYLQQNIKILQELENKGFVIKTVTGVPWSHGQPLPESNVWATRSA